jgi:hypothetical protein
MRGGSKAIRKEDIDMYDIWGRLMNKECVKD